MYILECSDTIISVLKIMFLYHLRCFVILYFKAVLVKYRIDLRKRIAVKHFFTEFFGNIRKSMHSFRIFFFESRFIRIVKYNFAKAEIIIKVLKI